MGLFSSKKEITIELGQSIFKALAEVMSDPTGLTEHKNISFSGRDIKQRLWIVGESQFQENISHFAKGWSYGFLIPEPDNSHDSNAIALYLINEDFEVSQVGYLKKEMATQVNQGITNLIANSGRIIPVLARVEGGTVEKPNMGILAWAYTSEVKFSK